MNEFKTCNICKGFDGNLLAEKLKEIDPNAIIDVKCQSMCAIGAKRPFVIVNGIPLIDDNIDSLIVKVKNMMRN
ncbi:MAG: DUF1450 domain-containing protein [Tenericutes bacterium]|jgi:uncharacterized protein YuzB (UPF0349 family)|nr:DUF1450 domain-containing protein [Bacilli bacterium]MDD4624182.1 DUF1450 domain-containing protein [Bacilli bacterium]MDD4831885.1 DUF1450 domain-containing protein [Bacilli bacterium]NLV90365.1 DUF1450 domain-containing protein [Mycoplasmatota bacterium]